MKLFNILLILGFLVGISFLDPSSLHKLFLSFTTYLLGNIGKLIALLGFMVTFIIYMMTHKGYLLFVGLIMSLIIGSIVGLGYKINEVFFMTFMGYFSEFIVFILLLALIHDYLTDIFQDKLKRINRENTYL